MVNLNNRLRAGVATLALTAALLLGSTAFSTSAFAAGECGAAAYNNLGNLNYDGTPANGKGPRMSNKQTTKEQYGFSFWVENLGKNFDDPKAKFIVHAGKGKTYTFDGWCLGAKPSAKGTLYVNVADDSTGWHFPILTDQLGALQRVTYSSSN